MASRRRLHLYNQGNQRLFPIKVQDDGKKDEKLGTCGDNSVTLSDCKSRMLESTITIERFEGRRLASELSNFIGFA